MLLFSLDISSHMALFNQGMTIPIVIVMVLLFLLFDSRSSCSSSSLSLSESASASHARTSLDHPAQTFSKVLPLPPLNAGWISLSHL
jgi:hypothetical protein